ncbi:MAG: response regulator, partial [Microbacteriaceae bacterium]|nr:response regulator [Burkholderiaceae bacterium]
MTTTFAPSAAQTWRVLIIDDSQDDRAAVRRLLLRGSDRRYTLTEADTGLAGLQALREADHLPECVVLDYNLPDMDAVEVLSALVNPNGLTACPVVVLTGSVGHDYSRAVIQAGAQDYLGKGWMTAESLTRAVENATERWAMARDLRQQKAAAHASEHHYRALANATSDVAYRMSAD